MDYRKIAEAFTRDARKLLGEEFMKIINPAFYINLRGEDVPWPAKLGYCPGTSTSCWRS